MNVGWLMEKLEGCELTDEVLLIVQDVDTREVMRGILSKVITDGSGAGVGKCELHGKG